MRDEHQSMIRESKLDRSLKKFREISIIGMSRMLYTYQANQQPQNKVTIQQQICNRLC